MRIYWIEEAMRDQLTCHIKSSALMTPMESEEGKKIITDSVVMYSIGGLS